MEATTSNTQAIATSAPKAPITKAPPPRKGRIQGRHCRFYIHGQACPFQNRRSGCWDVHDLEARSANLAKRNLTSAIQAQKQRNRVNVATRTKRPAQLNTFATMSDYDATSELLQKIKDLTIAKVPIVDSHAISNADPGHADAPAPKKNWDNSNDWKSWAVHNLSDRTASKFIAPYLPALINGTAPLSIFATGLKTAPMAPGAATTFPKFGLMPFELREQIWKFALAAEKCDCRITYHYELDQINRHIEKKFVPMNATPRFMHVNSEARALALKVYKKTFGTDDYSGTCWFNYQVDRLFLNTRHSSEYLEIVKNMKYTDRKRIRVLAIPLRDLIRGDEKTAMEIIAKGFKNLWRIDLVAGDGEEDSQWTRNEALQTRIKTWNKRLWLRVQPMRKLPPPGIRFSLIPAHTAHYYKIDGFKW